MRLWKENRPRFCSWMMDQGPKEVTVADFVMPKITKKNGSVVAMILTGIFVIEAMQRNGNERELGRGLEALPHYPG